MRICAARIERELGVLLVPQVTVNLIKYAATKQYSASDADKIEVSRYDAFLQKHGHTHTHTHTQRQTHTHRERERERERERGREREIDQG